jgi:hypothetical protein
MILMVVICIGVAIAITLLKPFFYIYSITLRKLVWNVTINITIKTTTKMKAMKYKTTITRISIHPENVNPVYGEGVTHVHIQDEAAGPFLTLSQVGEDESDRIRIDMEELEMITADQREKSYELHGP